MVPQSDSFHDLTNFNKNSPPSKLFSIVRISVSKDKFVCNICSRSFDKKCYLNLHMKYHNFQCVHCHRVYMKKIQLRRHLKKMHPLPEFLNNTSVEDYKCKACAKEFESKYFYKIHMWHYHRYIYVCQKAYCGILCYGRKQYDVHRKTHLFSNCLICGKIHKDIASHMRIHCKKYHCEICSKSFATSGDLKKHVLIHLKIKPYNCAECGKAFYQRFRLVDHLKSHNKEKLFSCRVCHRSYMRSRTLKNHMVRHKMVSYKVFQCDKCSFTSKNYHDLRKHKKREHSVFLKCNVCQKTLSSQETLDIHILTHSDKKPFPCSICVREFVVQSALTRHMKRFHPS